MSTELDDLFLGVMASNKDRPVVYRIDTARSAVTIARNVERDINFDYRLKSATALVDSDVQLTRFRRNGSARSEQSGLQSTFIYAFSLPKGGSTSDKALLQITQNAMQLVVQAMSQLYEDTLSKCMDLLADVDLTDDVAQDEIATRLTDVLEPFHSLIVPLFEGVMKATNAEPVATAFFLTQVLPRIPHVQQSSRLGIIRSVLNQRRPALKHAAVQALDELGGNEAKRMIADAYTSIDSSLTQRLAESILSSNQ